ncbi:thiamine phosphate synthase [bacterium]|nr:thiamine phosphate synthase [bacterium]
MQQIKGIYAIIDIGNTGGHCPVLLAESYLKRGIKIIQLRCKKEPHAVYLKHARQIKALKQKYFFTFIINDNPFLAKQINADGCHVGQGDHSVAFVRRLLGPHKIIGKSTHSLAQFKDALAEDTSYVALGAIFSSPTKNDPSHPVLGLDVLKEAVSMSEKPVVAIGGINATNAPKVWETGVLAIAMITALYR